MSKRASASPAGESAAAAAMTATEGPPLPRLARFDVLRPLGNGAAGLVYEAFDRERNATVALKALRRNDGRSIARFKKEFRSLVETTHENLVQLHELHADGDAWFFTMELVRGEDALSYVRPSSSLVMTWFPLRCRWPVATPPAPRPWRPACNTFAGIPG